MTHLTKLKLTDKTRTDVETNPEDLLRNKLTIRLLEQKELVEADLKGEQLFKTRFKFVTDSETGEAKRVEVQKQLRRWWWKDEGGQLPCQCPPSAAQMVCASVMTAPSSS